MRDHGILSPDAARVLNFLGFLAMLGVLIGAYVYQFYYRELPCTLCQLQRLAMVGVAFGAVINVVLGPDPRHYGVCLVSAVFGVSISFRQTLLHINPFFDTTTSAPTLLATSNPPFGEAVMGLHLYVWGLLLFTVVILAVGIIQFFKGQYAMADGTAAVEGGNRHGRLAGIAVGLLIVITLAETATTFLECGFVDCPNDGGWNWWILR